MKLSLSTYLILALLISLLAGFTLLHLWRNEVINSKRLEINNRALSMDKSIMQVLTRKEYSKLNDSLSKILRIKTKDIQYQIQVRYVYLDSTHHIASIRKTDTVKIYLKDTSFYAKPFQFTEPCYSIKGYVNKDQVGLTEVSTNDKIDLFVTSAYDHHFLFIRWGKYTIAKAYSECKKDTIAVEKFYHVVKNERAWRNETK